MLSCRRIVTGSLHGLIMADAYGIPSAFVMTYTARGGEYKFFDYFSTVNKFRNPHHLRHLAPRDRSTAAGLLHFDGRPIEFDYRKLLDACPFLERKGATHEMTRPVDQRSLVSQ